jgi:hypothetical protein
MASIEAAQNQARQGQIEPQSSAQLFGPGLEARAKHRAEAFAEFGSLRASVSSLELGLYTCPKWEGLVVALSAEIGDLNVAGPAVLSWRDCEQSLRPQK